ncbi:hypothetical protein RRG08_013206 [Elysia crispata]|uniref:Uncharacterized protein n=1 Tax=Elysia crispata TaxID=231223 RepID=A0AAE1B5M4_9GAST|nr:hypothetical protein RRG08_013206 [Elysia crispata]
MDLCGRPLGGVGSGRASYTRCRSRVTQGHTATDTALLRVRLELVLWGSKGRESPQNPEPHQCSTTTILSSKHTSTAKPPEKTAQTRKQHNLR